MSVIPYTTGMAPAVSGDIGDFRDFKCVGVSNLSSATAVSADVWLDGEPKTVLTAAVLNATKGTVRVQLGGVGGWLATAVGGEYNFEINIAFGPTVTLTWPARSPAILPVRAPG